VQSILAARVDLQEIEVPLPPKVGPSVHALAAAAVTRAVSGIVMDAMAI
jgi:hypothetical protein